MWDSFWKTSGFGVETTGRRESCVVRDGQRTSSPQPSPFTERVGVRKECWEARGLRCICSIRAAIIVHLFTEMSSECCRLCRNIFTTRVPCKDGRGGRLRESPLQDPKGTTKGRSRDCFGRSLAKTDWGEGGGVGGRGLFSSYSLRSGRQLGKLLRLRSG